MSAITIAPKTIDSDACLGCGSESDYGAHGIKNEEVYSEHWCSACWNKKDREKTKVPE